MHVKVTVITSTTVAVLSDSIRCELVVYDVDVCSFLSLFGDVFGKYRCVVECGKVDVTGSMVDVLETLVLVGLVVTTVVELDDNVGLVVSTTARTAMETKRTIGITI